MSADAYFDFITEPKQWDVIIDIQNNLPSVKQKLLDSFWGKVAEELKSLFSDREWFVEKSEGLFGKNSGLAVWHEEWKNVFKIGFGELSGNVWVGVYCEGIPNDAYNTLADQLKSKMPKNKRDSSAWPSWYRPGEDFTEISSFRSILPTNQEALASDYAMKLQEMVEKSKEILMLHVKSN